MRTIVIATMLLLSACAPKATFIQGGHGSSVQIEASMTGGHISLTGPFVYCADSTDTKNAGKTLLNCPIVDTPQ